MPEIILPCPQCERPLRVAEHLVGRLVQCPACGLTFSVPAGSPEGQPLTPRPAAPAAPQAGYESTEPFGERPSRAQPADFGDFEADARRRARSLVLPSAICLLVCSILGFLGDSLLILVWSIQPEQMLQQLKEQLKAFGVEPQASPEIIVSMHVVFAVLSLIIALAAIQMMRLRMYPFAIVGCILPMINCDSNCCLLGLPLGIWALVVLLKPEVRSAFQ
jgi:hypothetical protein